MKKILRDYFFWTYPRGSFHYDVMVTLILLFIFITPRLWNYGDRPLTGARPTLPIQVVTNGTHGLVITVQAADVFVGAVAPDNDVKKALKRAIEPVTGDAVFVERWELARDVDGNAKEWKVWVHR